MPHPNPSPEGEGLFSERARLLAGFAGAVLHWRPDEFWRATPQELAAIFECLAGDAPPPVNLAALKEMFPDG